MVERGRDRRDTGEGRGRVGELGEELGEETGWIVDFFFFFGSC